MLRKFSLSFSLSIVALAIGFANQILISNTFGTAPILDKYWIAVALVNFACFYVHPLRDAIVPNFHSALMNRSMASKHASSVFSLNIFLSAVALAISVIVAYLGQSFFKFDFEQNIWLVICIAPTIVFVSMTEILLGLIAALNLVTYQAVFRVIPPAVTFFSVFFLDGALGILVLPAALVAANCASSVFAFFILNNAGIEIRFCDPRQALGCKAQQMLATLLVVYLFAQMHVLIERAVFSHAGPGVISAFQYAAAIVNTLIGLVAAPLISILWPRFLDLSSARNERATSELLGNVLLFVALPLAAICIFVFKNAAAIVYVVFARGGFDDNAASMTATALMFLIFTAVPACLNQIVGRALNSQQNLRGIGFSGFGIALAGIIVLSVGWWTKDYSIAMGHWLVANCVGVFFSLWSAGNGSGHENHKAFGKLGDWIKAGVIVWVAYVISPTASADAPKADVFIELAWMFCLYFLIVLVGFLVFWGPRMRLFLSR